VSCAEKSDRGKGTSQSGQSLGLTCGEGRDPVRARSSIGKERGTYHSLASREG
jgi:hypothetical protein